MVAVTSAATLVGAAPAQAAFESTATAADAPDPDPSVRCLRHPVQYAVDVPEGTLSWQLDIHVERENGVEEAVLTPNRFSGAPTSGTLYLDICASSDPEGTWTLRPVVTSWRGADGVEHVTPVPGIVSTFEVGEVTPLACPSCEVSSRVTLRFVKVSGRWEARVALVNRYAGDPLRIREARLNLDRKTRTGWSRVATVLTDRNGRARIDRGLRPGRAYQASFGGTWIQYDDDHRLGVPKARSPLVRLG